MRKFNIFNENKYVHKLLQGVRRLFNISPVHADNRPQIKITFANFSEVAKSFNPFAQILFRPHYPAGIYNLMPSNFRSENVTSRGYFLYIFSNLLRIRISISDLFGDGVPSQHKGGWFHKAARFAF